MSSTTNQFPAKQLIKNFFKNQDSKSMHNLVNYCKSKDLYDDEILLLANGLAKSGEIISFPLSKTVCDIPSTGGPSSLSTLISPLFLKVLGKTVLKIGVPGRPAGGVDVLAQIRGYQINPNINEVKDWFDSSGYVHFIANDNFAPLDARLFQFRKENDAIDNASLVIASLLSKKIAAGVQYIGLDIRVSEFGNFGKTIKKATENGLKFNRVAKLAGIDSQCFLTDGNLPQQPYIGRGESILALYKLFNNCTDPLSKKHIAQCYRMAFSLSKSISNTNITIDLLLKAFEENIKIQGGNMISFSELAQKIEVDHKYFIYAKNSGILKINLKKIRDAIVMVQNKFHDLFPDPTGIILKNSSNNYVYAGDILCSYRCDKNYQIEFKKKLLNAFTIDNTLNSTNFKEIK